MITKTIIVLDPTAKPRSREFKMAVRPDNIEGKVLAFLWNTKPNGNVLLDRFAQRLNERYHFTQMVNRVKPSASLPATEDVLDELSARCDFVVIAIGDCGSCTSYVIHDAIKLEKRGIPTVSICSHEFAYLSRVQAQGLGMPHLAIVIIPHPIGGIDPKEVARKADDALDDMIAALTTPLEQLPERARQQSEKKRECVK